MTLRSLNNSCSKKYYAGVFLDIQCIILNTACKQCTDGLRSADTVPYFIPCGLLNRIWFFPLENVIQELHTPENVDFRAARVPELPYKPSEILLSNKKKIAKIILSHYILIHIYITHFVGFKKCLFTLSQKRPAVKLKKGHT